MIQPLVKENLHLATIGQSHDNDWYTLRAVEEPYTGLYEINPCGYIRKIGKTKLLKWYTKEDAIGYYVNLISYDSKKQFDLVQLLAKQFIPNPHNYPRAQVIDRDWINPLDITNIGWFPQEAFLRILHPEHRVKDINTQINTLLTHGMSCGDVIRVLWPDDIEIYSEYKRHWNFVARRYRKLFGRFPSDVDIPVYRYKMSIDPLIKKYLDRASIGQPHEDVWVPLVYDKINGEYEINPCGHIRNTITQRVLHPTNNGRRLACTLSLTLASKESMNVDIIQCLAKTFIENPNNYERARVIDPNLENPLDITNIGWFPEEAFPRRKDSIRTPEYDARIYELYCEGKRQCEAMHILWPDAEVVATSKDYRRMYNYVQDRYKAYAEEEKKGEMEA